MLHFLNILFSYFFVATVLPPRVNSCVASRFFSLNLKVLSQGNLRERSPQGPQSTATAYLRKQCLVLRSCLFTGGIILDNDQLDAHLLYFTIQLLQSSTCVRALYAHHQEVELYWCSVWYRPLSQWPSGVPVHRTATYWADHTRCCISTIQPPGDEHIMLETCRGL